MSKISLAGKGTVIAGGTHILGSTLDERVSFSELSKKHFPPIEYLVEGMIPYGLTFISGRPKVGKSLICADIALAVGEGGTCFGNRPAKKGTVYYVSFEDGSRRLKLRLEKLGRLSKNAYVIHSFPKIGKGCCRELSVLKEHDPDLVCVIFDTYVNILPENCNLDSYNDVYPRLAKLQQHCLKLNISAQLTGHNKKIKDLENPINNIVGSVAIQAACDSLIIIERTPGEDTGVFTTVSRDSDDKSIQMQLDPIDLVWKYRAAAGILSTNINDVKIAEYLANCVEGVATLSEIVKETKLLKGTVHKRLNRDKAEFEKVGNKWQVKPRV